MFEVKLFLKVMTWSSKLGIVALTMELLVVAPDGDQHQCRADALQGQVVT